MKSNPTWQSARIHALRDLTPTVREFVIAPAEGVAERWAPGAHLLEVGPGLLERALGDGDQGPKMLQFH